MRTIAVIRLTDVGPRIDGWYVIDTSVDFSGNLLHLTSEQPLDYSARTVNRYRLHRAVDADATVIELGASQEAYVTAEPFSSGRWLVAGWRQEDIAHYSFGGRYHLFSPEGVLLQSFDRPKAVRTQTTPDGRIWAGYHDQAVFDGDEVSAEGAVCFDETGTVLFGFNTWFRHQGGASRFAKPGEKDDAEGAEPFGMMDCYAMNVSTGKITWLYYIDDGIPLVQITGLDVSRVWPDMPVQGAHAFAIHEHRALFAGSYDEKDLLFLVNLDDLQVEPLQPIDEHGRPLRFRWESFGRGERLYLLDGRSVFLVDMAAL